MQSKQREILQYIKDMPDTNDIEICGRDGVRRNNIQKEWAQKVLCEMRAHLEELLRRGLILCDEKTFSNGKSFTNIKITSKGKWYFRKSIIAKVAYVIVFTVPVAVAAWISLADVIIKLFNKGVA